MTFSFSFREALALDQARRCIAEVLRHTYFQLPVTYHTDQITQAVLLIRWIDRGRDRTRNLGYTKNSAVHMPMKSK